MTDPCADALRDEIEKRHRVEGELRELRRDLIRLLGHYGVPGAVPANKLRELLGLRDANGKDNHS